MSGAKAGNRDHTLVEMVARPATPPPAHRLGEVWKYSVAVDVLGRIVDLVSGQELDALITERIAKPLPMHPTGFYVHEADLAHLAEARSPPDVAKKPELPSGGGPVGTVTAPPAFRSRRPAPITVWR